MFETVADLREFSLPRFTEEAALLLVLVAEGLSVVLIAADVEFILLLSVEVLVRVLEFFPELVLA